VTFSPLRAVLTGDVVASQQRDAGDRSQLAARMRVAYERVQQRFDHALPHPIAVFRGDSWQLYVADAALALHVGLSLRAVLRAAASVDTRIGLALDAVDTVDETNVSASMGPAFQRSGQALDGLQDGWRMRCLLPEAIDDIAQLGADALCDLADYIAIHWTEAQAQAVASRLLLVSSDGGAPSQAHIAQHWHPEPISQQAVSRHLQQAAWTRIETALGRFEHLVSRIPNHRSPTAS